MARGKDPYLARRGKAVPPGVFAAQLATLVDRPPEGEDWLHEVKWDGYRIIAMAHRGKVALLTRHGKDWTEKFAPVAEALEKIKLDWTVMDGEVVVLDEKGVSDFQALQAMMKSGKKVQLTYNVFDLPFANGHDLRDVPLIERKKTLAALIKGARLGKRVVYSEHVVGRGAEVLKKACAKLLEGIVSKRVDAPYVGHREMTWLKSKCQQRQEFVVLGFTEPQGSRVGFGSLLLGYHDPQKRLVYAGGVGTGFETDELERMHRQLTAIERKSSPLLEAVHVRGGREIHWVKPTLVAEVRFTGWTRDGMLRHPTFVGLRADKPAGEIVREMPVARKAVKRGS